MERNRTRRKNMVAAENAGSLGKGYLVLVFWLDENG